MALGKIKMTTCKLASDFLGALSGLVPKQLIREVGSCVYQSETWTQNVILFKFAAQNTGWTLILGDSSVFRAICAWEQRLCDLSNHVLPLNNGDPSPMIRKVVKCYSAKQYF